MNRKGKLIELMGDQGFTLGAFLVTPQDAGAPSNGQGLVLIQEIFASQITSKNSVTDMRNEASPSSRRPCMTAVKEAGSQTIPVKVFNAPSNWHRNLVGQTPKVTFKQPSTS